MAGHLWEVHELNGDKFLVVTTRDDEQQARELFRKVFGSASQIYKVKYLQFVHAVQST